ncbi:MAG: hypothetical protein IJB79_02935 [Candidatus Gastranaerophilales bacterium]|nr:hypothetical protein [Candidatus Gastranaerophilales bacterium]
MKKIAKLFVIFLIFKCLFELGANAQIDDILLDFDKIKSKAKATFKKKEPSPKPKMVETVQEWKQEAQNIPLEDREIKEEKQEIDSKKFHVPELKYTFEAYNYPHGKRELNLEELRKNIFYMPYLVADNGCRYVAYPYYYYSPDSNQISSNFYVEKLDTSKTKTKRILDYRHKQKERIPVIEAGTKEIYPNLFNGLTLVDWSADSKKLLIKEKIGSTFGGIYKTYLYIHFLESDIRSGYTIKLDDFDEAIKNYFLDWENRQIIKYRYDIEPLGFSSKDDNVIFALCYVYDKDGNKIFLGTWAYDCIKRETSLISKTKFTPFVSINGLILKHSYN